MDTSRTAQRADLLGTERIGRLLVKFAIPAILMMAVSSLYNIVDKIFVGQFVGDIGITATTVVGPVMRLISAFALLIGAGGNSLLALKLGQGEYDEAERILNNSFVLIFIISAVIMAVGYSITDQILYLFGCDAEALGYARPYMRIILLGTFFECVTTGFGLFIRTDGRPKTMMMYSVTGCVINVILDPIFIYVLGMGIAGAAWATFIAQTVSGLLVIYYFTMSKAGTIKLRLSQLRLTRAVTIRSVQLGFSSFLTQFLGSIVQSILLSSLTFYGAASAVGGNIAIASVGITTSTGMLFLLPAMGMQQAVQPIVGYNFGAKKNDRVLDTMKWSIIATTIMLLVGFVIIMLFAEQLCKIFGAYDEFNDHAAWTMRIYNLLLPCLGINLLSTNFFQAIGKPLKAVIIGLSRQVLCLIPLILILPRFFGLNGVIYALPAADFVSFIVAGGILGYELYRIYKNVPSQKGLSC